MGRSFIESVAASSAYCGRLSQMVGSRPGYKGAQNAAGSGEFNDDANAVSYPVGIWGFVGACSVPHVSVFVRADFRIIRRAALPKPAGPLRR